METYSNVKIVIDDTPTSVSGTFVRISELVKASSSVEGYYVYYKGETTSTVYAAIDEGSTDSDTMFSYNHDTVMIFNQFSGENATYEDENEVEHPLPIGMYYLEDQYVKDGERVYGLSSTQQSVEDPAEDLIVVWIPQILDDPVYNFLKDQKTTSVASGFPLRWRTKDTTSDYGRVGYSTRISTKKTIQLPGDQDSI